LQARNIKFRVLVATSLRRGCDRPEAGGGVMGAACSKTRLEGAIARWSLPSAGSRDKRVTLAACAGEPHGPPFDHSGWTAVLQAAPTLTLTRL